MLNKNKESLSPTVRIVVTEAKKCKDSMSSQHYFLMSFVVLISLGTLRKRETGCIPA